MSARSEKWGVFFTFSYAVLLVYSENWPALLLSVHGVACRITESGMIALTNLLPWQYYVPDLLCLVTADQNVTQRVLPPLSLPHVCSSHIRSFNYITKEPLSGVIGEQGECRFSSAVHCVGT